MYPDIIYIPLGEATLEPRTKLRDKLMSEGWNYQGKVKLKDGLGESVTVFVLSRSSG